MMCFDDCLSMFSVSLIFCFKRSINVFDVGPQEFSTMWRTVDIANN